MTRTDRTMNKPLKVVVFIVIVLLFVYTYLISSENKQPPEIDIIINSDNETELIINNILKNVDNNTKSHIKSINVLNRTAINKECADLNIEVPACGVQYYNSDVGYLYTDIFVLTPELLSHSFEIILLHEIGHVYYDSRKKSKAIKFDNWTIEETNAWNYISIYYGSGYTPY